MGKSGKTIVKSRLSLTTTATAARLHHVGSRRRQPWASIWPYGARKTRRQRRKRFFLGACSSGIVSIGGLDERTSFATLQSRVGTSAVVAPRWKIDARAGIAHPRRSDSGLRGRATAEQGDASSAVAAAINRECRHGKPILLSSRERWE